MRVRAWTQPGPDRLPPDHAARCAAAGESIDSWRRADIAFEFDDRRTITVDVRTTNALSRSALRVGSAATHLASLEAQKRRRYAGYYADFRPLVIALTGAVTEESFSTLKAITRAAATADGRRLDLGGGPLGGPGPAAAAGRGRGRSGVGRGARAMGGACGGAAPRARGRGRGRRRVTAGAGPRATMRVSARPG